MLPLEYKLKEQEIKYHFYADDTILFLVFHSTLSQCMFDDILTSIQRWFSKAKLKRNADKSRYMIILKPKIVKHGLLRLPEIGDHTEQVKVLGCYIDCQLTLQPQVNFVCSNSSYYLRKVWSIRDQVDTSVRIELIRVLVLSPVDYSNSSYYVLPNFSLAKLQRIMNSAALLMFRFSSSRPTSSYLKQLHWLQIRQHIVLKIFLYTHRFVHQLGKLSLYLAELMKRNTMVTRSQYFTIYLFPNFGLILEDVRFRMLSPLSGKKLSFDLKLEPSEISFRQKLKTCIF